MYIYVNSEKAKEFKKKYDYGYNYTLYANDFNLDIISIDDNYSFIYIFAHGTKKNFIYLKNEEKSYSINHKFAGFEYYVIDLMSVDTIIDTSKVLMYYPRLDWTAFFLYKNCLYQAEYNESFSDEELLLLVKEKIYKEDKKFSQIKKQIELYESSEVANTSKRTREPIPEDVKFEVWRRDQGRCVICGSQENLEFDHIIPFSKGGSSTARNIQLLCQNCNRHKSDKI